MQAPQTEKPTPEFVRRARQMLADRFPDPESVPTPAEVVFVVEEAWLRTPLANQHRENDELQAELERVSEELVYARQALAAVRHVALVTKPAKPVVSAVKHAETRAKFTRQLRVEQETMQLVIDRLKQGVDPEHILAFLADRGYRNALLPPPDINSKP